MISSIGYSLVSLVHVLHVSLGSYEDCLSHKNSPKAIVLNLNCSESYIVISMDSPTDDLGRFNPVLNYTCTSALSPFKVVVAGVVEERVTYTLDSCYTLSFEPALLPQGTVCTFTGCYVSFEGKSYRYNISGDCKIDRDECAEGTHQCGSNANCTNTLGSYYCTCHHGYEPDIMDGKCIHFTKECMPTCGEKEECRPMSGKPVCVNREGFRSSGQLQLLADDKAQVSGTSQNERKECFRDCTSVCIGKRKSNSGLKLLMVLMMLSLLVVSMILCLFGIKNCRLKRYGNDFDSKNTKSAKYLSHERHALFPYNEQGLDRRKDSLTLLSSSSEYMDQEIRCLSEVENSI